jgi:hypothetical protein
VIVRCCFIEKLLLVNETLNTHTCSNEPEIDDGKRYISTPFAED